METSNEMLDYENIVMLRFTFQNLFSNMRVGKRKSIPTLRLEYRHLMGYQRIVMVKRKAKETELAKKTKEKLRRQSFTQKKENDKQLSA